MKRHHGGGAIGLALLVYLGLGMPAAHADVIGNSHQQLSSLWSYVSGEPCAAIGGQTNNGVPSYPVQFWNTSVAAARQAGSTSWAVTIKGFLTLSYAPNPDCQADYVLGSGDLEVAGYAFVWMDNQWKVCQENPRNYEGWTRDYDSQTWGFSVHGDIDSGHCGSSWYYSNFDGAAYMDGAWDGYEQTWQNAGNSGPIWMY